MKQREQNGKTKNKHIFSPRGWSQSSIFFDPELVLYVTTETVPLLIKKKTFKPPLSMKKENKQMGWSYVWVKGFPKRRFTSCDLP